MTQDRQAFARDALENVAAVMETGELSNEARDLRNKAKHWILGVSCFFLAIVFLEQVVGLLTIQRIAIKAADPDSEVRIPLAVRFVGVVADKLHRDVLEEPLDPDGSNWPFGFRWFFILQVCGLAGISVTFAQFGANNIWRNTRWKAQANTILRFSCFALIAGVGFLKLIPPSKQAPSHPQEFCETVARIEQMGGHVSEMGKLVSLDRTHVTDLSPLANLLQMERLELNQTPVSDLTPLAGSTNLEELQLTGTHVVDLSPLANLKNLQFLDLHDTQVTDEEVAKLHAALPHCVISR